MSKRTARELEKRLLLHKIAQQRSELSANRQAFIQHTTTIDNGYLTLVKYRKLTIVGVGIIAIYAMRHPHKLMLWGRRSLGIWSTLSFVKNNLNAK